MKCPKCGKELQENARFCLFCMHVLTEKPDVTPKIKQKKRNYLLLTAIILCAIAVIVAGLCFIIQTVTQETSSTPQKPLSEDVLHIDSTEPKESTTEEPVIDDIPKDTTQSANDPLYTWNTVEAEGGVAVTGLKEGNYKIRDYVIPETIDGKTVVGIDFDGDYHYDSWEGVITLELPNTVTYIGHDVFHNCELEEIALPNSLLSIGKFAFQGSALKSLVIPDSVTEIDVSAFYACRELEYVKLSSSIKRIESHTFYDCQALTKIDIPASVTYIDDSAFYASENLTEVYIYSADIVLHENAFDPEYRQTDLTIYAREDVVKEYADREYYNNSYYNDNWKAKLVKISELPH